jgi:predicted Fe-Mo cluster-binding NifX family protein
MKVAVTAQGKGMDAQVDPRFGRAKFFIVVDTETGDFESIDNSVNLNAAQGAGIQSGKRIADLQVEAVLTGHVGPKAYSTLQTGGVIVYTDASGTVAEAVEEFKNGSLNQVNAPDVRGHWS